MGRYQTKGKTRIGVAWKGNPNYPNDHLRSTKLEAFLSLLNHPDVDTYALLLDIESELNQLPPTKSELICLDGDTDRSGTFVDSAALVTSLDAVITTDTSLAHLSGGLGTTTYLLLNKGSDWRWGTPMRPMTCTKAFGLFGWKGDWDSKVA